MLYSSDLCFAAWPAVLEEWGSSSTCPACVRRGADACSCSDTSANLCRFLPVSSACPAGAQHTSLHAERRQMVLLCTYKKLWLCSPTLTLVMKRLKHHVEQAPASLQTCLLSSFLCSGGLVCQTVSLVAKETSILSHFLVKSTCQCLVSTQGFIPADASSSHSYAGVEDILSIFWTQASSTPFSHLC